MKTQFFAFAFFSFLISCTPSRFISRQASRILLEDSIIGKAHIGIEIADGSGKSIFNYQGDKFFTPASNTKIFTTYAALKYLDDSIISVRSLQVDSILYILPMGDPTLLHPDFPYQPVIESLRQSKAKVYLLKGNWKTNAFGSGWSWGDYNEYYMAERSPLPVYGNVLRWKKAKSGDTAISNEFDNSVSIYSLPEVNWKVNFDTDTSRKSFYVQRNRNENVFNITQGFEMQKEIDIPFITHELDAAVALLKDTIGKELFLTDYFDTQNFTSIKSVPLDSLLRPMMHRSDNFFAEQLLLMTSQLKFGEMNERKMILHLTEHDLLFLNQKPRWADGSGLSRYNLFTPRMFTRILQQIKDEFGMIRVTGIFPTGGAGTLRNFFHSDNSYLYAKTGSLSGVIALSGYLITRKNQIFTFSILINNHTGEPGYIRKKLEVFLKGIRERY